MMKLFLCICSHYNKLEPIVSSMIYCMILYYMIFMGKPTRISAIVILPSKSVSPVNLSSAMHSGIADCGWIIQGFHKPTEITKSTPCAHQNPIPHTHHSLGKSSLKLLEGTQSARHKQNEWRMAHGTQCCNTNHPCFEGIPVVCFSLLFGWGGS